MPHPDDIKHVRPSIRMMTHEQIRARLEEITVAAKQRMSDSDSYGLYRPAEIHFMTTQETQERHELLSMLPTSAEEAEAARLRIQERIRLRREAVEAHAKEAGTVFEPDGIDIISAKKLCEKWTRRGTHSSIRYSYRIPICPR